MSISKEEFMKNIMRDLELRKKEKERKKEWDYQLHVSYTMERFRKAKRQGKIFSK